jgi:hypothetical protein
MMKLVIVNDCDRPEARLVAALDEETGMAYYLSARVDQLRVSASRPTSVTEFGCHGFLDNYSYTIIRMSNGHATYHDGTPREWQESGDPQQPLKKEFWPDGELRYLLEE